MSAARLRSAGALTWYARLVIVTGGAVLLARLPAARFDDPLLFVVLFVASVLMSTSKVHLPMASGSATMSMSYFTDFLALVLLGRDEAMLIAGASAASQCMLITRGQPSARQTLFSAATLVITIQAAGVAASRVGGFSPEAEVVALIKPIAAAAAAFFVCNSTLVATAIALARQASLREVWYENFLWTAPACLVGAAAAALMPRAFRNVELFLLAAGAIYVTWRSYQVFLGRVERQQRHLQAISDLHIASVEALARAIDARDQTIDWARPGDSHIRRVQAGAAALARAAGMSELDIEGVKVAALLHDIGKLAVPERILTKPGRLTPDEFERVRIHPTIGAEIIKAVPFPYQVAPFVQSHHERWDGSGYPEGLRGDAIPLGARVLGVVDYYDALRVDRPYRSALNREEAIEIVRSEAGRALDPTLVTLFLELLPQLEDEEAAIPSQDRDMSRRPTVVSSPSAGFSADAGTVASATVLEKISLATQEVHAIYDIARTLGTRLSVDDTMALLTSKLNRLVPASCWALFLYDRDEAALKCRFATGLAADAIRGTTIPLGHGSTGWVAQNRTALLNARAASDFEAAGIPGAGRSFQAALAYPLVEGNELLGTLTLYHVDPAPYIDAHRYLLDHVCNQAASVLRNSVLFETMRTVSLTDSLTDLPNSRALLAHMKERFSSEATAAQPSAVLMIDLDEFKEINDLHGHHVGDLALREVATTLRCAVRERDFCARYAGDEFVVVLPNCDGEMAARRARDLQRAVANIRLETATGSVRLAASVGLSLYPEDELTIEALLRIADRRMYEDKASRRVARHRPEEPAAGSQPTGAFA